MDKNKAMWEYIGGCPLLRGYLYFNSLDDFISATGFIPVSSDSAIESYVDGSAKREYIFAIAQMAEYDTGTSSVNLDKLEGINALLAWLKEQEKARNYPDFGKGCMIESIEVLDSQANLAEVGENGAKYMFQTKIIYIEEE